MNRNTARCLMDSESSVNVRGLFSFMKSLRPGRIEWTTAIESHKPSFIPPSSPPFTVYPQGFCKQLAHGGS